MSELVDQLATTKLSTSEVTQEDVADATTKVEEEIQSDKLMIRERTQIGNNFDISSPSNPTNLTNVHCNVFIVIKVDQNNKKDVFRTILESVPSSKVICHFYHPTSFSTLPSLFLTDICISCTHSSDSLFLSPLDDGLL